MGTERQEECDKLVTLVKRMDPGVILWREKKYSAADLSHLH